MPNDFNPAKAPDASGNYGVAGYIVEFSSYDVNGDPVKAIHLPTTEIQYPYGGEGFVSPELLEAYQKKDDAL